MPGWLVAVPGTNTFEAAFQATLPAPSAGRTVLWTRGYPGSYRHEQNDEKNPWTRQGGYWPSRSGFMCDPADPSGMVCMECCDWGSFASGQYEPQRIGYGGNASLKFIRGQIKDAGGTGVSGAVVDLYVTATKTLERSTTADVLGYYEAGTQWASPITHYIVAYRAGSPDISGTSVNTLTATNRDGT
jgi:hypothetical protein